MSKADFLYLVAQEDLRPAVPELRPDGGPYGELALADFPIGILHLMVRTHATRSRAAGEGLTRAVQEECWNRNPRRRPNLDEVEERLYQIARDQEQREGPLTRMPTSRRKQELALLHEILPPKVAKALSEGRKVEPEPYDPVTVFFSDIVGFTKIGEMRPEKVMAMLDNVYSRFDALAAKHGLFKVETIGDAYMCAGGIPERQADHTLRVARFALEAVKAAAQVPVDPEDMGKGFVRIRCGFHSGRVVASVVGSTNPRYCLFGDTVNVASRMESCSEAGRITMSKTSHEYLQQQCPKAQSISRGLMNVKVREHDESDDRGRAGRGRGLTGKTQKGQGRHGAFLARLGRLPGHAGAGAGTGGRGRGRGRRGTASADRGFPGPRVHGCVRGGGWLLNAVVAGPLRLCEGGLGIRTRTVVSHRATPSTHGGAVDLAPPSAAPAAGRTPAGGGGGEGPGRKGGGEGGGAPRGGGGGGGGEGPQMASWDAGTKATVAKIPLLKTNAGPRDKANWGQRLKEEYM